MTRPTVTPAADAPPIEVLTGEYRVWVPPAAGRAVELDLGCGRGGFLLDLAARYPERLVLGADVMLGRLRKVRNKARLRHLTNIGLLRANAWDLVGYLLPDGCLARVHLLCPDPWPKARHRAHRLVSSEFLGRLGAKLIPGGVLHLATDDAPYFADMQAAIAGLAGYVPAPAGIADVSDLQTDFERVFAREGKAVAHRAWQKVAKQ